MKLAMGPLLLLFSCLGAAVAADPASTPLSAPMPSVDYLLTLGPYGALIWGAYILGKGARVTVVVELSEQDRSLLRTLQEGRNG